MQVSEAARQGRIAGDGRQALAQSGSGTQVLHPCAWQLRALPPQLTSSCETSAAVRTCATTACRPRLARTHCSPTQHDCTGKSSTAAGGGGAPRARSSAASSAPRMSSRLSRPTSTRAASMALRRGRPRAAALPPRRGRPPPAAARRSSCSSAVPSPSPLIRKMGAEVWMCVWLCGLSGRLRGCCAKRRCRPGSSPAPMAAALSPGGCLESEECAGTRNWAAARPQVVDARAGAARWLLGRAQVKRGECRESDRSARSAAHALGLSTRPPAHIPRSRHRAAAAGAPPVPARCKDIPLAPGVWAVLVCSAVEFNVSFDGAAPALVARCRPWAHVPQAALHRLPMARGWSGLSAVLSTLWLPGCAGVWHAFLKGAASAHWQTGVQPRLRAATLHRTRSRPGGGALLLLKARNPRARAADRRTAHSQRTHAPSQASHEEFGGEQRGTGRAPSQAALAGAGTQPSRRGQPLGSTARAADSRYSRRRRRPAPPRRRRPCTRIGLCTSRLSLMILAHPGCPQEELLRSAEGRLNRWILPGLAALSIGAPPAVCGPLRCAAAAGAAVRSSSRHSACASVFACLPIPQSTSWTGPTCRTPAVSSARPGLPLGGPARAGLLPVGGPLPGCTARACRACARGEQPSPAPAPPTCSDHEQGAWRLEPAAGQRACQEGVLARRPARSPAPAPPGAGTRLALGPHALCAPSDCRTWA